MKKSRLQETSMEVTVGAFMFMILLALAVFTIVLSRENLFSPTYNMEIVFDSIMGLREGDNVFVRGVNVGKIKRIELHDDGVHVVATLDKDVRLHEDYRIEVLASSVLGGKYLNINQGTDATPLVPEDTHMRGTAPVDLIDEATRTIQTVKRALEQGGILKNLEDTMSQMQEITFKLSQGEGTLGRLLMDDKVYDDIERIAANLREVTDQIGGGQGTIGKLLMDDAMYVKMEKVVGNIEQVTDGLAKGEGTLGKLMSKDDKLYDDLASAAASIKEIARVIESGEGTVGRLVKDDEMYVEVMSLLHDARAAIDDFREASPVTTFASVFFGAF